MAEAKDKKAAPKAASKAPAKAKAEAKTDAKPAAKADAKTGAKKSAAATAAPSGPTCRAPKCKLAVRAKGYCRKHYIGWRRGDVGTHHRYKICSKEGCRKPRAVAGFCAEHAAKAPAAGAEASAPAAPAAAAPA